MTPNADYSFSGENQGDYAGYALDGGDVDGDGLADITRVSGF